jgi:transcriptional regulator with XRE-family HTH domain
MDICLSLLNRTHEDLSRETGIAVSKLNKLQTGEVLLCVSELQSIADELNIPARHLTQTYPSDDREKRLRIMLEKAELTMYSSILPTPSLEEVRLPPPVHRAPKTATLVVDADEKQPIVVPQAPIVALQPHTPDKKYSAPDLQQDTKSVPSTTPETKANERGQTKATRRSTVRKQQVAEEIDPAFIMTFADIDYNLRGRGLKKIIVDRIRYLRGNLGLHELSTRLAKKRSYSWLTTLGGITPAEVVDIANLCGTTAKDLVTGEGIVPLAAGEKASQWIERYTIETGDNPKDAALEILHNLKVWPAPLRYMIVKYIEEIM